MFTDKKDNDFFEVCQLNLFFGMTNDRAQKIDIHKILAEKTGEQYSFLIKIGAAIWLGVHGNWFNEWKRTIWICIL